MKRTELYYFAKGHLGQYEDWWNLLENEDGSVQIEHEWDHVSTGSSNSSRGTTVYPLSEGLQHAPARAVEKVKEILKLS